MQSVRQHLLLHLCFGTLLGSIQFVELGLNLQFGLGIQGALVLWIVGVLFAVMLNMLLALVTIPLVWRTSDENRHTHLGRGLLVVGMVHLGVLLFPFAITKFEYGQQALSGMLIVVWVLLGVLLHTNGRFWIHRLLTNRGSLSRLYTFFLVVSLLTGSVGFTLFQSRGYGSSNAILSDPDVLVVSVDGVGVNAMSAYQQDPLANTPNLDSLASQCLDYTEAISVSTEVLPSHVAMFIGRYPGQINIVDDSGLLKFASETLAERFAREGYATALFANSPVLNMDRGFAQGIQLIDVDEPLALFGSQIRGAGGYRLGEWWQSYIDTPPQPEVPIHNAHDFLEDYLERPVFAWVQSQIPDHLTVEDYRVKVESVDRQLGDFVRMLGSRRVERKRLLVITSSFGNHFEYGKSDRRGISEAVIRVPMIICPLEDSPHVQNPLPGQVRTVDIPNTVYAQVGFSHNKAIPSVDISDRDKEHVVYQTVLMGQDPQSDGGFEMGYRFQAAKSDIMYKYKWMTASKQHGVYNLVRDPTEVNNIVGIAGDMSQELASALTTAAQAIPNLKVTPEQSDQTYFQPIP